MATVFMAVVRLGQRADFVRRAPSIALFVGRCVAVIAALHRCTGIAARLGRPNGCVLSRVIAAVPVLGLPVGTLVAVDMSLPIAGGKWQTGVDVQPPQVRT
jgi:hypothetical protein